MSTDPAVTGPSATPARVLASTQAAQLLRRLRDRNGALMIHQSGGCCDGSSPMLYPLGDFIVGDLDVLLGLLDLRLESGEVRDDIPEGADAVPVWISGPQFEVWQHTQLVLDVVVGRGAGFSLETPEGVRLLTRGRSFDENELLALKADPALLGRQYEAGQRPAPAGVPTVVDDVVAACALPN